MRGFDDYNPVVTAVIFLSITGIAMFAPHPSIAAICLVSAVLFFVMKGGRSHGFFIFLFAVMALANPLVSHRGATVLFVVNDSPITLESLLYGVNSAAMAVGVIYWFRTFTIVMTSDKLLYITGRLSPKLSLVLSMSMRFIPLFTRQYRKTAEAQRAMGLFVDDNIIDSVRGHMRVFSIVVTWALEGSLTTAASMEARGCGTGKRTSCARYAFTAWDVLLLTADIVLTGICITAAASGSLGMDFYPEISGTIPDTLGVIGVCAYFMLAALPIFIETRSSLKWKYLKSKI